MNNTLVRNISEIVNHKFSYLSILRETEENTPLLFQYGPYLVMSEPVVVERMLTTDKMLYKWNCVFRLLAEASILLSINDISIAEAKQKIISVKSRCNDVQFLGANTIIEIANDLLTDIQKFKYDNKVLESAMLNFAPIVQYYGTIRKPELEEYCDNLLNETDTSSIPLDSMILKCLLDKDILVSILRNNTNMIECDDGSIPYDITGIYTDNINSSASLYFYLVYLRYFVSKDKYRIFLNNIKAITDIYNSIKDANVINVKEAIESFKNIEITDIEKIEE